jgi:type IV fimbrial biogenesis protein FimT
MIELLIAIGVISILTAVTLPSITTWRENVRLKSAARDLYSNFQKAKIEAVKRNAPVVISFSPASYQPEGKIGSYKMFVDDGAAGGTANDGVRQKSETLLIKKSMPQNVSLTSTSFTSPDHVAGYNANALPWESNWGNAQLQNSNSQYYRIILSSAGFVRMERSSNGSTWN